MTLRGERQADFAYQAVYRYMINLINEVSTDTRVKLPSLRQLAARLNVSISTIQYAYSLLEKEGRVYSVAKSGYYAWPMSANPTAWLGGDLLDRLYAAARRPGMLVLSGDEPALEASLNATLLRLERELVRQYPGQLQPWSQPCGVWELRAALAARYTSSPTRCWHADDVYIGADLRGVLDILIEVLGLKGTTVIVESPCDWLILRLLQDAGVRVIELPGPRKRAWTAKTWSDCCVMSRCTWYYSRRRSACLQAWRCRPRIAWPWRDAWTTTDAGCWKTTVSAS